jgi:copper transport protein
LNPPGWRRKLRIRSATLWISLFALLLIGVDGVSAHGYIIRAIPEDQARLTRAPARAQYWFSEGLEPQFSRVTVYDQTNTIIAQGGVVPGDTARMEARLPNGLPDGAYIVELRVAFASDGHVQIARQVFYVGDAAALAGQGIGSDVVPLEIVWRALTLTSFTLLVGALTTYALVFVPAWGSPKHPAGLLPPRVMARLNGLIFVGLAGGLAGTILALLQQTMAFFDTDLITVLRDGLWEVVRTGTQFGGTWTLRLIVLLIMIALHGASLYVRRDEPGLVRAFWTANGWAAPLTFATMSIASHAAGSPTLPWAALFIDWFHGTAVGVWIGGIAALALVLPTALRPLEGEARRLALLAALRRFSPIAAACLALTIATGAYSASNWIVEGDDIATAYTITLAIKVALVGGVIALGAAHHIALRPERYARWRAIGARVTGFLPSLRLEMLLAGAVLVSAAWLSATPVPQPTLVQPPAPTATAAIGDTSVQVTLSPGGPGVNLYDIVVQRAGQPAADAAVWMRIVSPGRDWRGEWLPADDVGDGLYTAAGAEIDAPGLWWMLIDVDGQRFAFEWLISADAAVQTQRPPTIAAGLALILVAGAIVNLLLPSLRRIGQQLDWSPAEVTVAALSAGATVIVLIVAVVLAQSWTAQYAADIQRPPAVVNPVLPDAGSLDRGTALLASACGWEGRPALLDLARRLPRLRDEAIYQLAAEGGSGLPACAVQPDDPTAIWDIVNAVRSLERPAGT